MSNFPLPKNAHVVPETAEKVFSGVMFDVYQWQQEQFDGSYATFEMLKRPHSVLVLALDEAGQVVVLEETQPGAHPRHRKLPGGRVSENDLTPLAAAQREMKEETGYEFANWKLIEITQPLAKIEWFMYVYFATDVTARYDTEHDTGEQIEVLSVPFEEFIKQGHDVQYSDVLKRSKNIEEFMSIVDTLPTGQSPSPKDERV